MDKELKTIIEQGKFKIQKIYFKPKIKNLIGHNYLFNFYLKHSGENTLKLLKGE